MSPANPEELAARATRGDRDALAELYTIYAPKLRLYFLKRGIPESEADDLVQDTTIRVVEEPWLFIAARNTAVSHLRARKRDPTTNASLEDIRERTSLTAESRAERRAVLEVLNRLPPPLRSAFYLRHFLGFTYAEMAELEGVTKNAIGIRLVKARRLLRGLLRGRL